MSINKLTHEPANPYCDVCNRAKMRAPKRFAGSFAKRCHPTAWRELIAMDHLVSKKGSMMGMTGGRDAFILRDLCTGVWHLCALKSKAAENTKREIKRFVGEAEVGRVYSDKSGEIAKACESFNILHGPSLPGAPQNNAMAERNNRDIIDGARASMIQAGFPSCFWPFAGPRCCILDNTV